MISKEEKYLQLTDFGIVLENIKMVASDDELIKAIADIATNKIVHSSDRSRL